ncbi:hypothetical protein LCGC14_0731380 [marine sediment metagenome]|uniref:AAA+ ATPase domain-containing protein n=1 Tax=marine sediment metagenome TaxID=412755 RepID=A0A0F9TGN8_9ZZZZ
MGDTYKMVKVSLETVDYTILVFQIPEEELNDKLTYFTREKGLISKSLYEDFLIATGVSNIEVFLQYIKKKGTDMSQLNEIRGEMVDKVLEINPKLIPSNLVVNSNSVVKLRSLPVQGGTKKDITDIASSTNNQKPLMDNEFWARDIYEAAKNKIDGNTSADKLDTSKIKNVKDLNYVKVQKFWRRIGQYITVKQFEPGSELVILGDRSFNTRTAFQQYVVTICVEEVEDLFVRLDNAGLPNRVSPPILMNELYTLCIKSNIFLDYDVYKDTAECPFEDLSADMDPFESFQSAAENSPEDALSAAMKNKKVKLFRHVSKETLLALDAKIKEKVIGQNEPIEDLVDAIQRASVGLKDPDQPIGSFIFTGYTGVGKTYTAKILAEELTGNRNGIVIIDCSEYSADHEYAKLIGAPSGYIGHEQGGYLTNAVKKNPFSVVLFDEIEKASDKVHQLLLQIMDGGRLTDGKGHKVPFKDTILIMTSNIGVDETKAVSKTIGFGDAAKLTKEKRVKAVKSAVKKKFKPEFLNRVTTIIDFDPLTKENYLHIIGLELEKLKINLKLNRTPYSKLEVDFDKSLCNHIYKIGIDEKFGARPLQRSIEREISTPLARKLLREDMDCANTLVKIAAKRNKVNIVAECIEKVDEPPFYMDAGNGDK